jgi:Flp pilus assembly protein TadG
MSNHWRSTMRTLAAETRGAEIAEAAAVLPLMFMFLLGIFWFGQAFSIYGAITRAAQEGARAGAVPYCATCSVNNNTFTQYGTNAVNAVQAAMIASKLDPSLARPPVTPPSFTACGTYSSACNPASPKVCVQAPVQMTSLPSGGAGICGISVSFQYPFQFWLPFTSLNKQQIWITASARVRMETH